MTAIRRGLGAGIACTIAVSLCGAILARTPEPLVTDYARAMVAPLPESLPYDRTFYKKYVDAHGIPVISSAKVPDAALLLARDIVAYMLAGRPDLRREMIARGYRVGVMAQTEMTTDIPEQRDRKKPAKGDPRLTRAERENYDKPGGLASLTDKEYWDRRARGLGGVYTTGAEENILGYPGTRYYGEHILVHEWSHGIMHAIRTVDPALYADIEAAYKDAMAGGKYQGHYAETNVNEYWAEGTQWWFWSNYEWTAGETRLQSPEDLKAYDPTLFALLGRVYIGHRIPADVYHGRNLDAIGAPGGGAQADAAVLRLLVVTGGHDYPTSFYTLFEQPGLAWDHETTSEAAFRRDLRDRYDVLVLYDMPATLSAAGRANLQAFAESGKGIVVMHHALCSHNDWDWYRDLAGARYQVEAQPGRPASTYRHDETIPVAIARDHPITRGLTLTEIYDETYKGMWISPQNTVLLTTTHPRSDGPLAWISSYPRSRVVAIQPGHGREAHVHPNYRALVRNAILWSAGRLP